MYKQNASPDTCFEALIVRVPWPELVAELERSGYDNAKFLPVELRRLHLGLRLRVRGPVPGDLLDRRAPAGPLRRDLLRPRGGALPPRLRRRRRDPAAQPAARRRLPARLAGALASRLHALGPDPRPHPHARRSALRPVHDPPAQPVLDVLARGAALRPDRVRRGGEARARGLRASPATSSTRSSSTASSASRSPAARVRNYDGLGGQLLFAFLHREGYLHWTDNRLTIEWEPARRGRRRAARARPGPLPLRHRPLEARPVDRRARPRRRRTSPPAESSVWVRDQRELPEVEEPKQLVDLVRDDEFPLSLFYTQLKPKLEPALAGRS